jgi:hypothetical protein
MAQLRVQLNHVPASNLPRDVIVTTFYLDTDLDLSVPGAGVDYQALADDAAEVFAVNTFHVEGYPKVEARVYDLADPLEGPTPQRPRGTREPRAVGRFDHPQAQQAAGPHEVALCLSYFAERNIPRNRGRMFIGPWPAQRMASRPGQAELETLQALAGGISGLGGIDVQWVQHSPTNATFKTVTNWFVDDEWDTQRSRGLRATRRLAGTVSG